MMTMSWTLPVDDQGGPDSPRIDRVSLWQAMLHKAEEPTGYVPAITECTVLERYEDGFLRDARRGPRRLLQRVVTDEAGGRITFQHRDDDWVSEISNEIGSDDDGRLTLTLTLTLAPGLAAGVLAESRSLRDLNEDFVGTMAAMTAALRVHCLGALTAAHPALSRRPDDDHRCGP